MNDPVERHDVEALLATRQELGPTYERELVDGFAERVEKAIATRAGSLGERERYEVERVRAGDRNQFVLGVGSLIAGIPVTAISGSVVGLAGLAVCWAGIVGINVAHAVRLRRH